MLFSIGTAFSGLSNERRAGDISVSHGLLKEPGCAEGAVILSLQKQVSWGKTAGQW